MGRGPPEGWWRGKAKVRPSTAFHAVPLPIAFGDREESWAPWHLALQRLAVRPSSFYSNDSGGRQGCWPALAPETALDSAQPAVAAKRKGA